MPSLNISFPRPAHSNQKQKKNGEKHPKRSMCAHRRRTYAMSSSRRRSKDLISRTEVDIGVWLYRERRKVVRSRRPTIIWMAHAARDHYLVYTWFDEWEKSRLFATSTYCYLHFVFVNSNILVSSRPLCKGNINTESPERVCNARWKQGSLWIAKAELFPVHDAKRKSSRLIG